MARPTRILRIPRTDHPSAPHILVSIAQEAGKPLDLKLVATEHEHLYHANIKESDLKSLQASSYAGHLEEWKALLNHTLLKQSHPEGASPETLQGLETVAAISGSALTLTLRKNIAGITRRLGSIKLEQDDDREEVSFPEWTDVAVASSDELRVQYETLQASVAAQQTQVAQLNTQLDELVKAKKEHEDELLRKFAALLNAKKLKIRDQQRLLAGTNVDPQGEETSSKTRSGADRSRKAGASRGAKRKANGLAEDEGTEVVDEEADENDDDLDEQAETPQPLEDEATEDEAEDAEAFGANPTASKADELGVGKKQNTVGIAKSNEVNRGAEQLNHGEIPPRRELPFGRRSGNRAEQTRKPEPPPSTLDDEDDETDDEL